MSSASEMAALFERWQVDVRRAREAVYCATTPRERERWHALWLLSRGLSQAEVADPLDRDAHTIGAWLEGFREKGPSSLAFEQTGGTPRRRPGSPG